MHEVNSVPDQLTKTSIEGKGTGRITVMWTSCLRMRGGITGLSKQKYVRRRLRIGWRLSSMLVVRKNQLDFLSSLAPSNGVSLEREHDVAWEEKEKHLKEGDKNTRFFHASAMIRRRRNLLLGLEDSEGVWQAGTHSVEQVVLNYFGNIFRANPETEPELATHIVDQRVTEKRNHQLTRVITSEEVKHAVFGSRWYDGIFLPILLAYCLC
ncbi:hypothetical protein LIER_15272 [Lithospermum erythrorhizon]|uniref:Uncharacterized protein n=1 Tax=Lithospermum erythrorhizon TaxID=34254 RepID=A0AAV3Q6U0_LITER